MSSNSIKALRVGTKSKNTSIRFQLLVPTSIVIARTVDELDFRLDRS